MQQGFSSEETIEDASGSRPVTRDGLGESDGINCLNAAHCGPEVSDGVDIIAVHGLCDYYLDTWKNTKTQKVWLRDFLADQLNIGDNPIKTRILSFGYDAKALFTCSNLNIDGIARTLLDAIETERINEAQNMRPIVFVTHSLGGVVVKKACCRLKTQ